MTLRWDLTEDDVRDEVKTILAEHGWGPLTPYSDDGETVLCVDIDEVSDLIARKLVAE